MAEIIELFDAETQAANAWLSLAAWLESPAFQCRPCPESERQELEASQVHQGADALVSLPPTANPAKVVPFRRKQLVELCSVPLREDQNK
jgi:hypothetical protein